MKHKIKQKLVELATDDQLPLDMNQLSPDIFDDIINHEHELLDAMLSKKPVNISNNILLQLESECAWLVICPPFYIDSINSEKNLKLFDTDGNIFWVSSENIVF